MAKAKVELAQAILDHSHAEANTGILTCIHCGRAWEGGVVGEFDDTHEDDCVVLIATEIVDDDKTHDW